MTTWVVYDIVSDKVRAKIADVCLDYGLERIQYSAFRGDLTTNRRQELAMKLRSRFDGEGCIHVLALCDKDEAATVQVGKVLSEREATHREDAPIPSG